MKLPIPFSRLAGLAAGSMVMGAALLPAEGQGSVENVNWNGTVNQLLGTGNDVANNSSVSSTINVNFASLALTAGNGATTYASEYTDASDFVIDTVNGVSTKYQGFEASVDYDAPDGSGKNVPCVSLDVSYGPGDNDGFDICYTLGTVTDSSVASLETLFNDGLKNSLPYNGDATFDVGFNSAGNNGAQGNITSFTITTNSPSARALFVKLSGGNAVVSYPTNTIGFQLQSSPYLGANANWKAVTNAPVLIGTNNIITLPIVPGSQFFRLGPTN